MPRYGIDFIMKGRIEIDAKNEEHAIDIFDSFSDSLLARNAEVEIDEIEVVEDYRDDYDE